VEGGYHGEPAFFGQPGRGLAGGTKSCPASISSAPKARMAAFFSIELPSGTTIVAASPLRAAASAMLWP
jgi:hypothetical protein